MNSVDIFFTVIHYMLYCGIGYVVYRKYILPHLLQERQNDISQKAQLDQRVESVQLVVKHFNHQIDYITSLFKKISLQYTKGLQQREQVERAHQESLHEAATLYAKKQERLDQQRAVQAVYKQIAPEVIDQVTSQLTNQFQQSGQHYVSKAIKKLQEESKRRKRS